MDEFDTVGEAGGEGAGVEGWEGEGEGEMRARRRVARRAEGTALEAWASALRAQEMELALQGARLACALVQVGAQEYCSPPQDAAPQGQGHSSRRLRATNLLLDSE